ncbi:hypothetical protein MtrunA17_Chr7g0232891 [Medicago truncatula]|uniref:Uncharacterized protein n=1 Tax=Medicago truncatula TaxID=3880 RepID=A0A396GX35_MEDTR|nr:hypothetical protein MtrunA17_Chr7g0232891 [Medicago truncatula]
MLNVGVWRKTHKVFDEMLVRDLFTWSACEGFVYLVCLLGLP